MEFNRNQGGSGHSQPPMQFSFSACSNKAVHTITSALRGSPFGEVANKRLLNSYVHVGCEIVVNGGAIVVEGLSQRLCRNQPARVWVWTFELGMKITRCPGCCFVVGRRTTHAKMMPSNPTSSSCRGHHVDTSRGGLPTPVQVVSSACV